MEGVSSGLRIFEQLSSATPELKLPVVFFLHSKITHMYALTVIFLSANNRRPGENLVSDT
jgi:hypothetical protein